MLCTVTTPWIQVSTIFRITWHDHAHTCTCKIESCEKKKIVPGLINYEYRICDGEHNREKNACIYALSSFGIEFLLSFFSRFSRICRCLYMYIYFKSCNISGSCKRNFISIPSYDVLQFYTRHSNISVQHAHQSTESQFLFVIWFARYSTGWL